MNRLAIIGLAAALTVGGLAPVSAQDVGTPAAAQAAPIDGTATAAPMIARGSQSEAILFYLIGGMVAASALGIVISTNIVRMAVFLFGTLGSVAVLYFMMAATFLGAIQLIVYAGGTLVVIIFGIMLTSQSPWARYLPQKVEIVIGAIVCLLLFGGLAAALIKSEWAGAARDAGWYEVATFGRELLTTYLVPFELASVLLLAVMIGAAYLARAEKR